MQLHKINLLNFKVLIIISIFLLTSLQLLPAEIMTSNWKLYSSQIDLNCATLDNNNNIWAGSIGGLFIYNIQTKDVHTFNSLNGIWDNEITEIYYDFQSDLIFAGSALGAINIFDNKFHSSINLDIYNSTFANKSIYSIAGSNGKLFIGTGFGLVVYDISQGIFIETILKFADFPANTTVNKVMIVDDNVYVATDQGVAYSSINGQLADPKNWKTISPAYGFYNEKFKDIIIFKDTIYTSSNNNIYKIESDSLVFLYTATDAILNLTKDENTVYWATSNTVFDINFNNINLNKPSNLNKFEIIDNQRIALFTQNGIGLYSGNEYENIVPNSPVSNKFIDLDIDKNNNLWVATGRYGALGLMKFDGENWENFTYNKYPMTMGTQFMYISSLKDGSVVGSGWGQGLIFIAKSDTNYIFSQRTHSNSALIGILSSPDYVVTGNVRQDDSGIIWAVNYGETSAGPLLVAFDKDTNSYGFENCASPLDRWYLDLAIDQNGTKWIASTSSGGLLYYNENKTLADKTDDICGKINKDNYPNILSNIQTSLAVDKQGQLWIGTPNGLSSIFNPNAVLFNQQPFVRSIRQLNQQTINSIYVDPVDNKWLATNQGLWLLNSDGSEIINVFNKKNSPLATDEIISVIGNPNTGDIYVGTQLGLYKFTTSYVQALMDYNITCYPQPFKIADDGSLVIDGLTQNSEIFITNISGVLVKRISTDSRKVLWDGRDEQGNFVATGIYLIYAQSTSNSQSSVQKVAIINN